MTEQGTQAQAVVGIIMGSDSDLPTMQAAGESLQALGIPYELDIVSAHRTPHKLFDFAGTARARGLEVIIAGAGGAAHLPGMVASLTTLPVIGVPINSSNSIEGIDSLLSIVQMPKGIPVATVAVGGAANAGLLAAQILGCSDEALAQRLQEHRDALRDSVQAKAARLKNP